MIKTYLIYEVDYTPQTVARLRHFKQKIRQICKTLVKYINSAYVSIKRL